MSDQVLREFGVTVASPADARMAEEIARLRALLNRNGDKLDRLRAENEALREALRAVHNWDVAQGIGGETGIRLFNMPQTLREKLDAALKPNAPFSGERSESAGTGS